MLSIMIAKQPILQGQAILYGIIFLLEVTQIQTYSLPATHEQQLEEERAQSANEWAPVVWLHPDEQFYPDDAHGFIKSTTHLINGEEKFHSPNDRSGRSFGNVKITPLREGRASWDTYLIAPIDSDCPNCPIPRLLFGKHLTDQESPQVYAVINSCLPPKIHHNRGRRTSDWNIIKNHQTVSENDIFTQENNGSYTPKRDKVDTNTSSNMFSTTINSGNSSDLSVTNTFSHLTSSHDGVLYNATEPENDPNFEVKDSNRTNDILHTLSNSSSDTTSYNPILNKTANLNSNFALRNKHPDNLFKVLLTRDKRVTINNSTDIPTENTDMPMRNVTIEAQARSSTEDGDINPHSLIHNDISQTLPSYNIPTQKQRFSVTYWMFYPYNHGKKVCSINLGWLGKLFKPRVNGVCHGQEIVMGNHIGDWEHISIDFIDNTPEAMYVSSHTFGAFYKYNPDKNLFYYTHQDTRAGINLSINFPEFVYMDNNHPVLYSALGSHGLWSKPGVHQYSGLPLLYDVTASGDQWNTWENLDVIDLRNEESLSMPYRKWLGYEGRWGNPPKNCHALLGGFCQQNHGPTGIPRKRVNFPCKS
ncbi:unnamed protein product [Meganyctiphanes norvegica]|uniref:Vacuolar protein sorting-associated protein 62 n=1 Tax=Meganyctiphanes norvegica TaxID=48144 RepID=A0AAV2S9X7_MEGNR